MDLKTVIILVLFLGIITSHFQIKYLKHKIELKDKQIKELEYLDKISEDYD